MGLKILTPYPFCFRATELPAWSRKKIIFLLDFVLQIQEKALTLYCDQREIATEITDAGKRKFNPDKSGNHVDLRN